MSERDDNIVEFPGAAERAERAAQKRAAEIADLEALTDRVIIVNHELLENLEDFLEAHKIAEPDLYYANLEVRRSEVADMKDPDIVEAINTSTPDDWTQRPTYYAALVELARERGIITGI